jgi:MATE family multidrug resistance protein
MGGEALAILALGGPLVAHNLANMGMQFADTVMAGRLAPRDLAAVAVGANIWVALIVLVLGILMALSPTVAHLYGAGRRSEIGHYTRQGFWLSQLLAWSGFAFIRHLAPLMHRLGVDPAVVPLTDAYLDAISWGLPAMSAYLVLRFTSEGVSHTRPMLFISSAGMLLNILANWVLMYGHWGFPRLGAAGCGYASAFVMWFMAGLFAWYVAWRKYYRAYGIFERFELPHPGTQLEILRLGVPIGVSVFMEASLFSATGLLMATLGADVVAGHQIAVNWGAMMFMVPMGLAMAISVRVGQALGRGDPAGARFSSWVGVVMCGGFMLVSAAVMLSVPGLIASLYTHNPAVHGMAVSLLGMAAIFQLSDGLQVSAAGALRGYKDTRVPMLITIVAYWLVGFPLAWWLGVQAGLGPRAVWSGLIGGLTCAAVLLGVRLARTTRRAARS